MSCVLIFLLDNQWLSPTFPIDWFSHSPHAPNYDAHIASPFSPTPHFIETKPQRQSQRLVPTCPCARKEKKYLVWHISSLPSMTPLSTLLTYRDEKLWCASLEAWKSRQIATNPPHMRPCLPPKMLRPGARNWVSRLFTLRFEGLVETRPSRLDLEHSLLFGHWLEMEWRLDVLKMLHPFLRTALVASLDVVVVVFRFPMIGLDDVITIWIYCRFLHFNETVVPILLAYQCTGSRIVGYCRWMVVPKGNKGFVCPFCISARKKTSPACINQPDKTRSKRRASRLHRHASLLVHSLFCKYIHDTTLMASLAEITHMV